MFSSNVTVLLFLPSLGLKLIDDRFEKVCAAGAVNDEIVTHCSLTNVLRNKDYA